MKKVMANQCFDGNLPHLLRAGGVQMVEKTPAGDFAVNHKHRTRCYGQLDKSRGSPGIGKGEANGLFVSGLPHIFKKTLLAAMLGGDNAGHVVRGVPAMLPAVIFEVPPKK